METSLRDELWFLCYQKIKRLLSSNTSQKEKIETS